MKNSNPIRFFQTLFILPFSPLDLLVVSVFRFVQISTNNSTECKDDKHSLTNNFQDAFARIFAKRIDGNAFVQATIGSGNFGNDEFVVTRFGLLSVNGAMRVLVSDRLVVFVAEKLGNDRY